MLGFLLNEVLIRLSSQCHHDDRDDPDVAISVGYWQVRCRSVNISSRAIPTRVESGLFSTEEPANDLRYHCVRYGEDRNARSAPLTASRLMTMPSAFPRPRSASDSRSRRFKLSLVRAAHKKRPLTPLAKGQLGRAVIDRLFAVLMVVSAALAVALFVISGRFCWIAMVQHAYGAIPKRHHALVAEATPATFLVRRCWPRRCRHRRSGLMVVRALFLENALNQFYRFNLIAKVDWRGHSLITPWLPLLG